MKKLLLTPLAVCLLLSCQQYDFSAEAQDTKQNIQFVMKGLSVDYSTRATLASESITDLYVIEGTTLLCHQVSTDTDFGAPTVALTIGTHDLTFIASKSDGQTFTDHWRCDKVRDTYATTLSYTVTTSTTTKQVQLTRANARLQWTIEDAIPTTATTLTISTPQCYGLDADLNGTDKDTYSATASITSKQGQTGYTPSTMVIPANHADGDNITATITITDGTSTICTYSTDCLILANTITNIHGSFFSGSNPLSLSLANEWSTTTDYDIH